jgi:uncharacterized DUF497 family protein
MFEWDAAKSRANVAKHGVSFETASRIFEGPVLTRADARFDYGEVREISVGAVEGTFILAVVHTDRRGVTRIISARAAKRRERKAYAEALQAGVVARGTRGPAG